VVHFRATLATLDNRTVTEINLANRFDNVQQRQGGSELPGESHRVS
jgi:hypothetical protein